MLHKNSSNNKGQENLFTMLMDTFFPFWPLLAFFLITSFILAWGYLQYKTPVYEVSATLIIKDENKGVDDAKMVESMNPFDSKKIVENEIKVIQSRDLMRRVVENLQLNAPILEEKKLAGLNVGYISAYQSTPVRIKLKDPSNIVSQDESTSEHFFTFDSSKNVVRLEGKSYPINKWTESPFGTIMFLPTANPAPNSGKRFFFSLYGTRDVTRYLLSSLEVVPPEKLSTVVNLYFNDENPKRGEDILDNLIKSYNQKAIEDKNVLAANTMKFIEGRIRNVENELDQLEAEIQQYRSSKGVVDLNEQGKLYLQDAGENDRKIADARLKLSILNKVENYIESKNTGGSIVPSTLGINDPVLTQLLQKLYDSEIQYERLKKTTAVNNPILLSLAEEIERVRPNILDNVRSQKSNLQASLSYLSASSGRFNSALKTLPEQERKLLEISRRKAVKKDLFAYLLQKREEIALSNMPTGGDGEIVASAESSFNPVSPKGLKTYGIAFFLGMGIWIGIVVIREMLNRKVLFRSEIEDLTHLPVMGELPFVKSKENNMLWAPNEKELLEQLRQLAAKLGLYSTKFVKKKILITSNIPGEGKSFVSKNLAFSLAQSGKRVALLDMDFRRPFLTRFLDLSNKNGIVNYLKGDVRVKETMHQSIEEKNLTIIPAGTKGSDHTKLLLNGRIELLFDELSDKFDYIIMDSAPVGLVSDVNLLAEFSDSKLLVVRHGVTPKKILQRLGQNQKEGLLDNMGIVFNGIKNRGFVKEPGSGYGYTYTEAYGY